jgi:hypothetical protein
MCGFEWPDTKADCTLRWNAWNSGPDWRITGETVTESPHPARDALKAALLKTYDPNTSPVEASRVKPRDREPTDRSGPVKAASG